MPNSSIKLHYVIDGKDFSSAGEASSDTKKTLRKLGVSPETIRKVAIAMYEGEINTVIHGGGGVADVEITGEMIKIAFKDEGPGIEDIEKAMQEGYSTASEEARNLGFGAGMGLPNMKKYSDNMKIDTEVGKGTRVEMIVEIQKF